MPVPNNVGYVTEVNEERPIVHDKENGKLVPGDIQYRFKLKLRNTLGKERVVVAVLADAEEVSALGDFFSSTAPVK